MPQEITKENIRAKLPGHRTEEIIVSDIQEFDDHLYSKRIKVINEFRGCFDEIIYLNYFVVENDVGFYKVEKTIGAAIETFLNCSFQDA